MYWMLECYRSTREEGRSVEDWPDVPGVTNWNTGARFPGDVPEPIALWWDPDDDRGPPRHLYKAGIPMMSMVLHQVLREAGVDTIDTYRTVIRSHSDPEDVREDYLAFNVVGLVAAADMERSKYQAPIGEPLAAVDFDSVVIDEAAAAGALFFRLAQCLSAIVIHDRVKTHLERADLGLTFVRPEAWSG